MPLVVECFEKIKSKLIDVVETEKKESDRNKSLEENPKEIQTQPI